MFSRRHYVAVAEVLADVREHEVRSDDEERLVDSIVYHFEALFERDNPNFDSTRFLEAVGVL
jgi:hypothetical protein